MQEFVFVSLLRELPQGGAAFQEALDKSIIGTNIDFNSWIKGQQSGKSKQQRGKKKTEMREIGKGDDDMLLKALTSQTYLLSPPGLQSGLQTEVKANI